MTSGGKAKTRTSEHLPRVYSERYSQQSEVREVEEHAMIVGGVD